MRLPRSWPSRPILVMRTLGRKAGSGMAFPSLSERIAQQADEAALIALYDAALVTATATERELWQHIRDEHAAHLAALGWQGDLAAATPASATPAALRQAERRATRVRAQAARSEPDAQRAQVLALIAASEAQHAVALS